MGADAECSKHNFYFDAEYMCPMCEGALEERHRIISVIQNWRLQADRPIGLKQQLLQAISEETE